jgi:hypothetical protein
MARGAAPDAFDLVWYQPPVPAAEPLPLDAYFRGVEAVMLRSTWGDEQALYAGFKGGFNQANHGHLDLGSFVMEAAGVRWAMDLGPDDYDLPGYWERGEGGGRWKYFRLNNHSHNTLVINGDLQRAEAKAPIVKWNFSGRNGFAIADLTTAYRPHVSSLRRGVKMVDGKALVIQDEIHWASEARTVRWQMLTDAEINLAGAEARLTKNGKALFAKILSPAGVQFGQESAEQAAPENRNKGCMQLTVTLQESQPTTTLCVLLSVAAVDTEVVGLDSWSCD